jgi:hypothetical protein
MDKSLNVTDAVAAPTEQVSREEDCAVREYELFVAQGIGENESLSDWLTKEHELRRRLRLSTEEARTIEPQDGEAR